jgi:hypothetical protein
MSRKTKGHLFLFNHFIDMRTTDILSISCRKNVFLLKFSNKNMFFPHEMDKLTVVLMSIKRLNKERRPLALKFFKCAQEQYFLRYLYEIKSMTNFYFYAFLFQLANCWTVLQIKNEFHILLFLIRGGTKRCIFCLKTPKQLPEYLKSGQICV